MSGREITHICPPSKMAWAIARVFGRMLPMLVWVEDRGRCVYSGFVPFHGVAPGEQQRGGLNYPEQGAV